MKQIVVVGTVTLGLVAGGWLLPNARAVAGEQLVTSDVDVPRGDATLGTVNIPRRVMANSVALAPGSYDVQLTAQSATPDTVGALSILERWVEFRQGDDVRGREVVTIVPGSDISDVAKSAAPGSGSSRVEVLKENEYIRIWINQSGTHYLIHLVVG